MNWREGLENWPGGLPRFELTSQNNMALLTIDMQHYCAHRGYGLGKIMKEKFPDMWTSYYTHLEGTVIPNQQRLLRFFRQQGWRVIHVAVGPLLPDGSDMFARRRLRDQERIDITNSPHFFHKGTVEHSILEELTIQPGELVVDKNSSGTFNSTPLDQYLRNMGIDSLIIVGVLTNACVETTARDAADRGYNCILVEDGCASFEQASHEATLRSFARIFGKVMTTEEVLLLVESLPNPKTDSQTRPRE